MPTRKNAGLDHSARLFKVKREACKDPSHDNHCGELRLWCAACCLVPELNLLHVPVIEAHIRFLPLLLQVCLRLVLVVPVIQHPLLHLDLLVNSLVIDDASKQSVERLAGFRICCRHVVQLEWVLLHIEELCVVRLVPVWAVLTVRDVLPRPLPDHEGIGVRHVRHVHRNDMTISPWLRGPVEVGQKRAARKIARNRNATSIC
mmetsp:Transcript_57568/g.160306  ORF Transcript_57568/g.160306 Transcript_57568/m.160306 type:complete len:203 (-) Transcript_57568:1336-1944(-)